MNSVMLSGTESINNDVVMSTAAFILAGVIVGIYKLIGAMIRETF